MTFRSGGRRPKPPLSELEHLVLDEIWSQGNATAESVRLALEPARPLKDSTIRTVLRRLEAKGYATHTTDGRTYVYRGIESRESLAARAVKRIADRFCGGSMEKLLVGMVESEVIAGEELERLAREIASRRRPKK